ncbi:hypothetical protein H7X46_02570 [Pseudonocardia sp. C8]|uniref:hypothetical protein n=1 Tax=Pseudonocardia sp. C8 TaxID=2762759 RepID=UPI001643239A|nr:hypothetical protein [Pseudonocardia sp. C8]MBC3189946.1 hypothetical protein [Pseudonocardia sp. C8]
MTETMTAAAPTSAGAADVDVRIEDDATPLVRLLGRTLRDAVRAGHALETLTRSSGAVAVRSHDTPQAATIRFGETGVDISDGVLVEPDAVVTVDLHARFASTTEPDGDADLAAGVLHALTPPVPWWREAAQRFWDLTRTLPGMPETLVVVTEGPEGVEQLVLGEGPSQYLVASDPDSLAGIFSGADDLFAVLSSGALGLQGTLSQLSVMTGASWKVRFDA